MKTLFVAAVLALTSLSASATKNNAQKKVSINVIKAFESEFGDIQGVSWSTAAQNMVRANFTQDEENISAFFQQNGEYIATTIERKPADLPAKLRSSISHKFPDGIVTEALEFMDNDGSAYFIKIYTNGAEKLYKGTALGLVEEVKY